jgi:hypothetical protein
LSDKAFKFSNSIGGNELDKTGHRRQQMRGTTETLTNPISWVDKQNPSRLQASKVINVEGSSGNHENSNSKQKGVKQGFMLDLGRIRGNRHGERSNER